MGEIIAVQNFGAGDLLEVRLAGSGRPSSSPSATTPCRRSTSPPAAP